MGRCLQYELTVTCLYRISPSVSNLVKTAEVQSRIKRNITSFVSRCFPRGKKMVSLTRLLTFCPSNQELPEKNILIGIEGTIDKQIASFINLLETHYLSTSTEFHSVDVEQKVDFIWDTINAIVFGKQIGYLERNKDLYDYLTLSVQMVKVCWDYL